MRLIETESWQNGRQIGRPITRATLKTLRRKTWRATRLPESICSAAHRLMRKGPPVLIDTEFRKETGGNDRNCLEMKKIVYYIMYSVNE